MLALASVWIGLLSLLMALVMLVYRPAMTDFNITLVLWFGAPGGICLGGLVLWAYRKELDPEPGIRGQRRQARTGIVFSLLAAAVVYGLIIGSHKFDPTVAGV